MRSFPKALMLIAATPMMAVAAPLLAQSSTSAVPSPEEFVARAGASDLFEITTANMVSDSKSKMVQAFAQQMIADHTKSTDMIKTAATADGLTPADPVLTPAQTKKIAALKMLHSKARDTLYVSQQKVAHQQALALMKGYSATGTATNLRKAATDIAPVVQTHRDMLTKLTAM